MCLGMWALAAGEVSAQDMKLVSGRIVNKNTKKPFGQEAVFIYAFNTVAEAEDARKVIDSKNGFFESSSMEAASADGYYQITVPETGALIFKVGVVDCVLEKVNYRLEINVEIESNEILKQVDVVGMRQGIQPMDPDNAEIDGNSFRARNKIPIPAQYGKSNARLILQPYLLDGNTGDTVRFLDPMVYDGEQYHLTQERRMGYDTGKDPLMHYVRHDPLVADGMVVDWADTVYLDDPMKSYCVKGVLLLEDYNRVYHREEYLLASARIRRPLKFLEYTLGERQLDPNKYKERPRRERRNTAGNISLTFVVGKAQLDPKDTMNRVQVDKLKSDLLAIVEGEGSQLKEFHIRGVASPDGSYASNLALAKKRVQFAQEQITSVLPRRVLARVYQNPKAEVAPWTAVADLLFADSLKQEAGELYVATEEQAQLVEPGQLFAIRDVYASTNEKSQYIYCKKLIAADKTAERPLYTASVTAYYYGTLINGEKFDGNFTGYGALDQNIPLPPEKQPTEFDSPADFTVSGVVSGWTTVLQYMRKGERWIVYIPWASGYGSSTSSGGIPGYSTLVFDMQLTDVMN